MSSENGFPSFEFGPPNNDRISRLGRLIPLKTNVQDVIRSLGGINSLTVDEAKALKKVFGQLKADERNIFNTIPESEPDAEAIREYIRINKRVIEETISELTGYSYKDNAKDKGDMGGYGW